MTLIKMKPYKDSFTNKIEIFNETTIFVNSFITMLFMFNTEVDELQLLRSKKSFATLVIVNIVLNIVINMAIVAFQGLYQIFLSSKRKLV